MSAVKETLEDTPFKKICSFSFPYSYVSTQFDLIMVPKTCLNHGFKLDTKDLNFGYSARLKGNERTTINFTNSRRDISGSNFQSSGKGRFPEFI
jgi:hypothetical protein